MTYLSPNALGEAFDFLEQHGAMPIAGCTDWFPAQGDRIAGGALLDVTGLPGFRGITRTDGGWRIGAATRWGDIVRADLPSAFDGLRAAARKVGSVQIQNAGTIGGNLCNASPAADGMPPLLTLDARVELVSRGAHRNVALSEFVTGVRQTSLRVGELVSALLIPSQPEAARSVFLKAGTRRYLVISITMIAVLVVIDDGRITEARVAVGASSPVARRLPELEAALAGRAIARPLPAITPDHLAPLSPISDLRGSAEYRQEAVVEMIARALGCAMQQGDN